MGWPTWLYHAEHPATIFDSDEVPDRMEEGWTDAPAPVDEEGTAVPKPIKAVDPKPVPRPKPPKPAKPGKVGGLGGTSSGKSEA